MRFNSQLDPFALGISCLGPFPPIDEPIGTTSQSAMPKHAPRSPSSPSGNEESSRDESKCTDVHASSPSSDGDVSDPTGGVAGPFDEEDYCGWLAEGI